MGHKSTLQRLFVKRLRSCLCSGSILDVRFVCGKNKAHLNWYQPSLQADPALTVKHWTHESIMFVILGPFLASALCVHRAGSSPTLQRACLRAMSKHTCCVSSSTWNPGSSHRASRKPSGECLSSPWSCIEMQSYSSNCHTERGRERPTAPTTWCNSSCVIRMSRLDHT